MVMRFMGIMRLILYALGCCDDDNMVSSAQRISYRSHATAMLCLRMRSMSHHENHERSISMVSVTIEMEE